ncbi:hypothetical protein HMPREF0765_3879 [Sphingobacterium spiritivorum ATCC 33300]|uniref:Uncharacterized protein n=1 Tax=Sphingobacterium spiritivorum ATCC 33300 TaxID=525372 RepID=C2G2S3_SPHSI|nr:hypothetical protein HMPREF0765_3879 [Sphingobacterium spiritivorum ATCC 33300]
MVNRKFATARFADFFIFTNLLLDFVLLQLTSIKPAIEFRSKASADLKSFLRKKFRGDGNSRSEAQKNEISVSRYLILRLFVIINY